MSNEEKREDETLTRSLELEMEKVGGNGLLEFQKDLEIIDDEDPAMLIICWKLNCKTLWEISKDEFMNGFSINGCYSLKTIKEKIRQWKSELQKNDTLFRKFYNFVFDYLREDKTVLGTFDSFSHDK